MLTIATKTKLKPEAVIKQAVDFFGPKGYKMVILEQSTDGASFEGGGGGVGITAVARDNRTEVELISREWDYQVKEFIAKIS